MVLVVGAGTAGCQMAPYVAEAFGARDVILVDTPEGVHEGKVRAEEIGLDVSEVQVAYGSPSGAHRNFERAMEESEKSKALKQLIKHFLKRAKREYRAGRIPVIVWGLGGATGAATAIRLSQALGRKYSLHITILPNYRDKSDYPRRLLSNAAEQLRRFLNGELEVDTIVTGDFVGVDIDEVGEHLNHVLRKNRQLLDVTNAQNANYIYASDGQRKVRSVFLVEGHDLVKMRLERVIRRLDELAVRMEDHGEGDIGGTLALRRDEVEEDEESETKLEIKDETEYDWEDIF